MSNESYNGDTWVFLQKSKDLDSYISFESDLILLKNVTSSYVWGPKILNVENRRTMIEWLYLILCPYLFCHSWIAFEGKKKGNNRKKMQ